MTETYESTYRRVSRQLTSTKALVVVVVLIVAAVLLAGQDHTHSSERGGPVAAAPGSRAPLRAGDSISESVQVGALGSFGGWILENTSQAPVTLLGATVSGETKGLKILPLILLDQHYQTVDYGRSPADLPESWMHPLAGYVLKPTPDYQLIGAQILVRVEPTQAGHFSVTHLKVSYRQGSRHYERDVYARDLICAGSASACPTT